MISGRPGSLPGMCGFAPILFNIFTAVLNTAEERFRADPQVKADLVSIRLTLLLLETGMKPLGHHDMEHAVRR